MLAVLIMGKMGVEDQFGKHEVLIQKFKNNSVGIMTLKLENLIFNPSKECLAECIIVSKVK